MALLITALSLPVARCVRRLHRGAALARWLAVVLCAGVLGTSAFAQTGAPKEYQLKAVFLFNFAQFVEWPPTAFPTAQAPLVIGVLGDDPFKNLLDETVRGETVNGHPIVVQRYRRWEDIKSCHVLFISKSETERLPQIIAGLKGRSILTVGDSENFAVRGGMIRFTQDKNHLKLRINLEAAKAEDLNISSKLLRPAEIVGPANP